MAVQQVQPFFAAALNNPLVVIVYTTFFIFFLTLPSVCACVRWQVRFADWNCSRGGRTCWKGCSPAPLPSKGAFNGRVSPRATPLHLLPPSPFPCHSYCLLLIFSFFFHPFFHLGLSIRRVHGASFQHYVWVLARCSSCKKMLRETPPPSHLRVKTQTKSNRELTLVLSTKTLPN